MKRIGIAFALAIFGVLTQAQSIDNTVNVSQFPGVTVGAKLGAAMQTCTTNALVPCILILDPSLAAYVTGTMPSLCSHCYLWDFRSGPPASGASTGAPLVSPAFTGTPTAPTKPCASNTDIATGAYVANCADASGAAATALSNAEAYSQNLTSSKSLTSDYGAYCNAIGDNDLGSISSGSHTLTDSSGWFTPALATTHAVMIIQGAGTGGAPLQTTIATYIGPTQVTLTAAASTTVSGAWLIYGTDDTVAINDAYAAAAIFGVSTITIPTAATWCLHSGTIMGAAGVNISGGGLVYTGTTIGIDLSLGGGFIGTTLSVANPVSGGTTVEVSSTPNQGAGFSLTGVTVQSLPVTTSNPFYAVKVSAGSSEMPTISFTNSGFVGNVYVERASLNFIGGFVKQYNDTSSMSEVTLNSTYATLSSVIFYQNPHCGISFTNTLYPSTVTGSLSLESTNFDNASGTTSLCLGSEIGPVSGNATYGSPETFLSGTFPAGSLDTVSDVGVATHYGAAAKLSTNGTGSQVWSMNAGGTQQGWQTVAGGGSTNTVTPEQYGAVGDGKVVYDGVLSNSGGFTQSCNAGTGITLTAPSVTTTVANSVVISIFDIFAVGASTPAGVTLRVSIPYTTSPSNFGLAVYDQTVATAGVVPAVVVTTTNSNIWSACSVVMVPTSGHTVSFVAAASNEIGNLVSTTMAVNVPSGYALGDALLGSVEVYTATITPPTAFTTIFNGSLGVGLLQSESYKVASGSEPASYTWTQSSNAYGMAGFILDYRNVQVATASTITSASAAFTSADVGKCLCTAKTATGGTGQQCGTISSYISSSQVVPSYTFGSAVASGGWVAYGTDNHAAFTSMMASAPCSTRGCLVQFGPYNYATSLAFPTLPPNVGYVLSGTGGGASNMANNYLAVPLANANAGTILDFLTTSLSGPAMQIGNTSTTSTTSKTLIENLSLYGGVGLAGDGGGNDGIQWVDMQGGEMDHVGSFNFTGRCAFLSAPGGTYEYYITGITIRDPYFSFCGGAGLQIGSGSEFFETIDVDQGLIEANGGPAIVFASNQWGCNLSNMILQWNNRTAANPEIYIGGVELAGCTFAGNNYYEIDANLGSKSNAIFGPAANLAGLAGNYFGDAFSTVGSGNPFPTHPTYSAAGTAIAACDTTPYHYKKSACVRDSTACTNGTTYTSGGSTTCSVECNGTNWIETGAAQGCY